ncbi:MAG: hypothetical protein AAGI70_03685 [Pseudomonadota bacterium]
MSRLIGLALAWMLVAGWALAQETAPSASTPLLEARAAEAVENLAPLLQTRSQLETQIEALTQQISAAREVEKPELEADLADLRQELASTQDQISVVATGISERAFDRREPQSFNLQQELQDLIEPFVLMLRNATAEARRIEATRRALDSVKTRASQARLALQTLSSVLAAAEDPAVVADLEARRTLWVSRVETSENQIAALEQQLEDLLTQRISAGAQVETAARGFFRERGLSLLLGLGAFLLVLTTCRLIARLVSRAARGVRRSFQTRLANLLFTIFTIAASFAAMLIVFNLRSDWLLLGFAALILIALVWIGIRMLPGLVEQVTLLLNLGAVQEDERVVLGGIPYKVERLDFYSDLANPALDGGCFTVPVRQLIGLHSRPAAEDEAWFPSMKDDWVRLADGHAGQVVAQTPEMVVLQVPGGARVTYQTADYLAQTPQNLSHGYRAEVEFGIGYGHQAEATGKVIETLKREVSRRMTAFLGAQHIREVGVEFLRAGASSLDYEVEVDLFGTAAPRFEDAERELARVLVEIATEEGWEIPFQQVVLHRAGA